MARREVTAARKAALLADLRESCRTGELVPGDRLPPSRELAAKYQLAQRTITMTLQHLIDDGTLQAIPRVGIVVAEPMEPRLQVVYLAVAPASSDDDMGSQLAQLIVPSYESQIARLGGRTARVSASAVVSALGQGEFESVGGVFVPGRPNPTMVSELAHLGVPMACYGAGVSVAAALAERPGGDLDLFEFDNVAGGREAATLLLEQGSRRIGFAGVHLGNDPTTDPYPWSIERGVGWREAVAQSGGELGAELLPARSVRSYPARSRSVARRVVAAVERGELDAVVCANDAVALQVIAQLRERGVEPGRWPALVGFDSVAAAGPYLLTSFRLPWEAIGRAAADLLWRRPAPLATAELRIHQVRMDLTQRLSTEPGWAESIADRALFSAPVD